MKDFNSNDREHFSNTDSLSIAPAQTIYNTFYSPRELKHDIEAVWCSG